MDWRSIEDNEDINMWEVCLTKDSKGIERILTYTCQGCPCCGDPWAFEYEERNIYDVTQWKRLKE